MLFAAIIFAGLFVSSIPALADGEAGLIPCGNGDAYADRCTLCHLVKGFKGLIDYGFNIFIFVALATLLAAGIFYIVSTGNQEMMGKAKTIMMNTLFGFAFVLLGWLLVNFTIYILGANVGVDDKTKTWYQFECVSDTSQMGNSSTTSNATDTTSSRSNCNGTATAHSQPCDNANPSSSTTRVLYNDCPSNSSGKCYDECIDGYSMKKSATPGMYECVKDSDASEGETCGASDKGKCMASCPAGYGSWSGGTSCGGSNKCCVAQNTDVGGGCTDGHNTKSGTCRSGSSSVACPSGEASTSKTSTHCVMSHGSGEARCCTTLRTEGCKSMAEGENWTGQCFTDGCINGWTEKSGVNIVLGAGCDSGAECCLRN